MAIVFALQKWRHNLMGRHFIIQTDQRRFKFSIEQRLMREVQYKPGTTNRAANALSRQMTYGSLSQVGMEEWGK